MKNTLYHGRPEDVSDRLEKEIACYALLDSLGVAYDRVDHDFADTIEACEAVPKSKKLLKFTLNDGTDKKRTILSGIHEYYEPEQLVGKTCVAITNLPARMMMGFPSEGMLISAVYEYDGHEGLNLLMLDDAIPAGAKLY